MVDLLLHIIQGKQIPLDTFLTEDEETQPLPTQPKFRKTKPNAKVKESQTVG